MTLEQKLRELKEIGEIAKYGNNYREQKACRYRVQLHFLPLVEALEEAVRFKGVVRQAFEAGCIAEGPLFTDHETPLADAEERFDEVLDKLLGVREGEG